MRLHTDLEGVGGSAIEAEVSQVSLARLPRHDLERVAVEAEAFHAGAGQQLQHAEVLLRQLRQLACAQGVVHDASVLVHRENARWRTWVISGAVSVAHAGYKLMDARRELVAF